MSIPSPTTASTAPAPAVGASVFRGKHLTADFEAVAIHVEGTAIRLTRREFELLQCLVENRNRVLSRDRLLERCAASPLLGPTQDLVKLVACFAYFDEPRVQATLRGAPR